MKLIDFKKVILSTCKLCCNHFPFIVGQAKLSKYFKVSGIPTLIFLDGETGNVINKNGRSAVDSDPEGEKFPWKGKTLQDILSAGEYISNRDEKKSYENDIKGKVLGIYFSAHWVSITRG